MKYLLSAICLMVFMGSNLNAQLELPQKSPAATTSFQVGLTTVTISYSSPGVKDREIWGGLVPYNEVWRAGANKATTVEFDTDVKVQDKFLAKGKYALFLIPKEGGTWTAIFNKVWDQWGAYRYDPTKDALKVEIKTKTAKDNVERMSFSIVDKSINTGYIRFAWEKKRAYILFRTDIFSQVATNLKKAATEAKADEKWLPYALAANFYFENGKKDLATKHIKTSVNLAKHTRNLWIESKILADTGDYKAAVADLEMAIELGEKANSQFYKNYKDDIKARLAEYKAKL